MTLLFFVVASGASLFALGVTLCRGREAQQEIVRVEHQHNLDVAWCERTMLLDYQMIPLDSRRGLTVPAPDTPNGCALRLLLSYLTPEQAKTYALTHTFDVRSQRGNLYRIHCDRTDYNVERPDRGMFYCTHVDPQHLVPLYDEILAQMMLLRTDENKFLRVANTMPSGA